MKTWYNSLHIMQITVKIVILKLRSSTFDFM